MSGPKRSSWLPPFAVFIMISFMYTVYLGFHILPQLRRLNFLQYTGVPLQKTVPNDPHMHPAGAVEVVALLIGFHICFALFIAAYFQAMVTPAGSVPANDPKWERGQFGIDEKEDREVEKIIRDINADLTNPTTRELIKRMPIVERKKAKVANPDEENSPLVNDLDDLKRKCHGCMVYKPDRCHHCSVCGGCVLRMDHRQTTRTNAHSSSQRAAKHQDNHSLTSFCVHVLFSIFSDCPWIASTS